MAVDGAYCRLYLTVTAKTVIGQSVAVSGSSSCRGLGESGAEAIPMVTSPSEWPVWRTPKPIIVSRNVAHAYQYSLFERGVQVCVESASTRSVFPDRTEMRADDVFGDVPAQAETCSQGASQGASQQSDAGDDGSNRMYIVCYHLPVRLSRDAETSKWSAAWDSSLIARSENSIADELDTHWIGTVTPESGYVLTAMDRKKIELVLEPMKCIPLFVPASVAQGAYNGYCKQILWPSFHNVDILDQSCAVWNKDGGDPAKTWDQAARAHWWEAFEQLNRIFRDALLQLVKQGDTLWLHDYHLMLLPSMLAESEDFAPGGRRMARIIFFMHVPFPTSQIFRSLTRGEDLLQGVVGADVVGFHAFDHARHFLNACKRLMGLTQRSVRGGSTGVEYGGRTVMVVVRYVSIEPEVVTKGLASEERSAFAAELSRCVASALPKHPKVACVPVVLAGMDTCQRLSGISLKLLAWERFLCEYEQWRGKVVLVQYGLTDGKRPDDENRTSSEVKSLVDRINLAYPGSVRYREMKQGELSTPERLALWTVADVLVGTAIKEGLNLSPFEYLLARRGSPGVILASEFSATASLLNGVLRLNPFDVSSVAAAFDAALTMSAEERAGRHARDLPAVLSRSSGQWTRDILSDMRLVTGQQRRHEFRGEHCLPVAFDTLLHCYQSARRRVLLFDYGGTLIGKGEGVGKYLKRSNASAFMGGKGKRHGVAERSQELTAVRALERLADDPQTFVCVVSGATMQTLLAEFAGSPRIGLAASNGLVYAPPSSDDEGKREFVFSDYGVAWGEVYRAAIPLLSRFTARTNGSSILFREPGVAWSYYRTDPEWGRIQAKLLMAELANVLAPFDVEPRHLEGMIEIVPRRLHKGAVVKDILAARSTLGEAPDFVMCAGDATSDEKMFSSLYSQLADDADDQQQHRNIFTVTVGNKPSRALFYVPDQHNLQNTLATLAGATDPTACAAGYY